MRSLVALLGLVSVPLLAVADDASHLKKIEQGIEKSRQQFGVPGASLAIIKDDKIIFAKGFGYRDFAKKLPATPETIYAIGSSTKAFTGLLVSMAAEEGKLALSDSPKKLLPEFRLMDKDADKRITIQDLLCHRSGLPRTDLAWYSGAFSRSEILSLLGECTPTAKLRTLFQYQNVMFMAAGELVSRAYQTPYDQLLAKRVFSPLGMSHTTASYTGFLGSPEQAIGYAPLGPVSSSYPLPLRNIDIIAPAGAINSNVLDMAQWVRLQINRGEIGGKRIADEKIFDESWKSRIEMVPGSGMGYGYGWMVHDFHGTRLVEHGGNIDGFNAQVAFLPDKKIGLVMLTNVSSGPLAASAIETVFSEFVPEETAATTSKAGSTAAVAFKEPLDANFGDFDLKQFSLHFSIRREKGKVVFEQSPVTLPLTPIADYTYSANVNGKPLFKLTFAPDAKDPKVATVVLEQNGMKLPLTKTPPYQATITGDALLAKAVAAIGTPGALKKLNHVVADFTGKMSSDGVELAGRSYEADGTKQGRMMVLYGLKRRFGTSFEGIDGQNVQSHVSFQADTPVVGSERFNAINDANKWMDLNPSKWYSSVKVVKEEKVGTEDAYVLEKKPRNPGGVITDWISKSTFRLLQRKVGSVTTTFGDFHEVEGVTLPFSLHVANPQTGPTDMKIEKVSFTAPIPDWAFGRRKG